MITLTAATIAAAAAVVVVAAHIARTLILTPNEHALRSAGAVLLKLKGGDHALLHVASTCQSCHSRGEERHSCARSFSHFDVYVRFITKERKEGKAQKEKNHRHNGRNKSRDDVPNKETSSWTWTSKISSREQARVNARR